MASQRNDLVEQRAQAYRQQSAAHRKELTFTGLSQLLAKLLIIAAGLIWLRAYWVFVSPTLIMTPEGLLNFVIDVAIAVLFAAAQAVLPPLLLSAFTSNSPANIVLTHIKLKIGWFWFVFALGCGSWLTAQSFNILFVFWASRPNFLTDPPIGDPRMFALGSLVLLVGFPSWALNQLTPDQWVDSMLMARSALRIKHIIDLEDATGKALIARVRGLLLIDTMQLTLEQRAANNAEVAGILAGAARGFKGALNQVAASYTALGGYEMNLQLEQDDEINQRFGQISRLLTTTTDQFAEAESFAHGLAAPSAPVRELPQPSANAAEAFVADQGGPPRTGANADAEEVPHREALEAIWNRFEFNPWKRADVEDLLRVEKTSAALFISHWKGAGVVEELKDPKWTYVIVSTEERARRMR